ncbi:MAG TPA: multiheme c-type cytochrome [Pirellulales bacterium]|nr:multiheme c-type cytochrome [Pirellulales bacterium]
MFAKTRIAAALLCLVALALLVAIGQAPRAGPPSPAASSVKAAGDCRGCHEQVWREWQTSYHSRAWSDDPVQAAFQHFGFDRRCQSCHAPVRELVMDVSAPIELRADDPASGVDCLSCHGLAEGGIAAARTIADAPCRPREVKGFGGSRACGACHQAIYQDWHESRYRTASKECQSCHMPAVAERAHGRNHVCLGGHDLNLIRSAAKLSCRRDRDELVVSATNHATGHNFPGERHNRVLYLQVIERNSRGEITLARQELIKGITPFRGESSAEKLRIDQTFEARFPIVGPPVVAEVQLLYKSFPWYPDAEALVVAHAKMELGP